MKQLIMITNYFPFGSDTGEMYLRHEIFEASRIFDQVIILSCDAKDEPIFTDNLPQNVLYFALDSKLSKISSITMALSSGYLKDNQAIICERKNNTFARNLFLNYFLNKVRYRIKKIQKLEILKSNSEDKIIIYAYRLFDLAMIGIYLKEQYFHNAVVVSRAHGYDLYEDRNRLNYLPCRIYLMSRLHMIYPCSFDGEKYLKNNYKSFENKILCSYLGSIDYGFKDKCNSTTFRVISCSNVIPVKRVDKIAEVIFELSKRIDIVWTHIGDGAELDKIKKKYCNEISNRIMLFTGKQKHEQVIKLYQGNCYDLFINLSESEGIPQAMMEALSFGIPVLATNVGGNSEIVLNDYTGYLVEKEADIHKAADNIDKYSKINIESINIMRRNCRKRWEDLFDAKNNSTQFFEGILNRQQG